MRWARSQRRASVAGVAGVDVHLDRRAARHHPATLGPPVVEVGLHGVVARLVSVRAGARNGSRPAASTAMPGVGQPPPDRGAVDAQGVERVTTTGRSGGVASSTCPPGSTVMRAPARQRAARGGGAEHLVGPQVAVGLGEVVGVPLLLDARPSPGRRRARQSCARRWSRTSRRVTGRARSAMALSVPEPGTRPKPRCGPVRSTPFDRARPCVSPPSDRRSLPRERTARSLPPDGSDADDPVNRLRPAPRRGRRGGGRSGPRRGVCTGSSVGHGHPPNWVSR